MSSYSFTDPETQQTFKIKVPTGLNEEQARAIFEQQLSTGSLTGFSVGATLSAATQAAAGLPSAQAAVAQVASIASGKLPVTSAINTISSQLGAVSTIAGVGGSAATALVGAAQAASSLLGRGTAIASNVIGVPVNAALAAVKGAAAVGAGIVGGVVNIASQIGAGITGGVSDIGQLVTKAGTALTGAAAQVGSVANTAVKNLAAGLTGAVTNGINTADLVKQGTSLALSDLNSVDTQAALSQAAKLVGQPRAKISDELGVGKFGFDLSQLEKAGYVKPGTAAVVSGGSALLTDVLKSPTVFTGKDGVKNVNGLLNNETLQNNIQTGLMQSGLTELKSAGIPIDSLNPGAIAGLATAAAKSVGSTLSTLQGTAPPDVKAAFDNTMKNSSFAVSLANTKVTPAVLGEVSAAPATNTVNNETLDAAATRVVGNPKVPSVTEPPKKAAFDVIFDALEWINQLSRRANPIDKGISQAQQEGRITQTEWDRLDALFKSVAKEFNADEGAARYVAEVTQAVKELPEGIEKDRLTVSANVVFSNINRVTAILTRLRRELNALKEKIQA